MLNLLLWLPYRWLYYGRTVYIVVCADPSRTRTFWFEDDSRKYLDSVDPLEYEGKPMVLAWTKTTVE